jgi:PRTRC genetic system protein E
METNFFQSVAALEIKGDLNITIKQTTEGNQIVSVLLNNNECGNDARKLIPPIILSGTAAEIDEVFFVSIGAPIETTSQIFVNMESYMKAQEQAVLKSKMEKNNTEKAKTTTVEKDVRSDAQKKYDALMKKVDDLEAEGKYKDAWMRVPDPSDYPEQADLLRQRRESLSVHFPPSLF